MSAIPTYGYSDTPTPLPPPPRRVEVSGDWVWGLWLTRLFLLPHLFIGIAMIGMSVFWILAACFARDIPANVDNLWVHESAKGIGYGVDYYYQAGDRSYSGSTNVTKSVYDRLSATGDVTTRPTSGAASQLIVHHFNIGPFRKFGLGDFAAEAMILCVATGFWNAMMSLPTYWIWIIPLRRRRLCKHGQVIAGKFISRLETTGRYRRCYATCSFPDPATGAVVKEEMLVPKTHAYLTACEGDAVTILYLEKNPPLFTVYEFCGYTVQNFDASIRRA